MIKKATPACELAKHTILPLKIGSKTHEKETRTKAGNSFNANALSVEHPIVAIV